MQQTISLLISTITRRRIVERLLIYFILFVVTSLVSLLLYKNMQYRTPYAINDEYAHEYNLFFQNSYSALESSTFNNIGDFRWIVKKTSDTYTNLTDAMGTPLLHTIVSLGDTFGINTFGKFEIALYSENTKQIQMTGQNQRITFNLIPGHRTYSFVVPGTYLLPYGRWPISITNYQKYGISSDVFEKKTSSTRDERQLVVIYMGSSMHHFASNAIVVLVVIIACVPSLIALCVSRNMHKWLPIGLYLIWIWRWVYEYFFNLPFSSEPILYALITGASILVLQYMVRASLIKPLTNISMIVIAVMSATFYQFNVSPVATWMYSWGSGFDSLPHVTNFAQFISNLRAPMPIPLFAIEYVLYRIHNPLLFDVGYMTILPRIFFIVAFYVATDELDGLFPYSTIIRQSILLFFTASIQQIVLLDRQQNSIYMYDAMIGLCIVFILILSTKQTLTKHDVLLLSFSIVLADMLRPFMMVITPIIVIWIGYLIYKRTSRSLMYLFIFPLFILLIWHGNHIFVLKQLTWSNYSGYNLARAWHPEAIAERPYWYATTQPNAVTPATSINDEQWGRNSNYVLHKVLDWVWAHPLDALARIPWLLWQTFSIPITISRVRITGEIELRASALDWFATVSTFFYRVGMGISLWGSGFELLRQLYTKKTIRMIPFIVTFIVVIVALTENGEQARFLLSLAPAVLYAFIRCLYTFRITTPQTNDFQRDC